MLQTHQQKTSASKSGGDARHSFIGGRRFEKGKNNNPRDQSGYEMTSPSPVN